MKLIEPNIDKITALCRKCRVEKLWVFGSVLTERFNDDSDVDFSVNFDAQSIETDNLDWSDIFFGLLHELEDLFGRRIDLICDDVVKNPIFRKELDETKRLIYG